MPGVKVAFIHASPAAVEPLMNYFAQAEPGWTVTNLLDDGIMRQFRLGDSEQVESGLISLIDRACSRYGAQAALITCSAASLTLINRLRKASPVPLVKIDEPMARAAVTTGARIGVVVTFPPTAGTATALLQELARSCGKDVTVLTELREAALAALLHGDPETHDRILREAARSLIATGAEVIVLAQVSMARLREPLEKELGVPVFSSLETSHRALKEALDS